MHGRRPRILVIAIVLCILVHPTDRAKAGRIPAHPGSNSGSGPHTPQKWAVLVGIDEYLHSNQISPLAGSINDVQDMRDVLIGKFEFLPENIVMLTGAQATHAAIIDAIKNHLIAHAEQGDIVVFDYSGHGSQMPDATGKMINGVDETIVPYDSRDDAGKVFDISGAELHPLLQQLAAKTKNVTFILDSCHSGTLVRGPRARFVAADTRKPPPAPAGERGIGLSPGEITPKFVTLAAATSKESAFEHFADGKDHGALTYFLVRQLRAAKAGVTYRDIMDAVVSNVNANYPMQHPSIEGADADQFVFGDGTSLARSYVMASPSLLDPHKVTVATGQVEGATVGSIYEVYLPGQKRFAPPETPIAKVQLASVEALSSEAIVLLGKVVANSRAVEREHRYGNARMRVFIDSLETSPTLQSIRDAIQPLKSVQIVDRPQICNLQLREAAGRIQTLAADSTTLSAPIATNDPALLDRIVGQVTMWAKWFNVLSIHNPHSEIELGFTLKGTQTRDPMANVGKPDMGLWEGETVEATITNSSERDVYVAMLDISSDGSISVVYPTEQGAMEVLKPGSKLSRSLVTSVPKGRSVVTDILKVFAGYKPFDLRPLTQSSIRAAEGSEGEDPLSELLRDAGGQTRQVGPVSGTPTDLRSWTVKQAVVKVKRRNG